MSRCRPRLPTLPSLLIWLLACTTQATLADTISDLGDALGLADSAALRATVLGPDAEDRAPLPDSVPLRELNVSIDGAMPVPDVYWFNRKLRVYFSAQKEPAPLAIVIAGTGGNANASRVQTLRKALYQDGHHVLTLPSPTNPNFIVAASSTGVAGDLWQDGLDLHRAIGQIVNRLSRRHHFTEIVALGYSLGGANAALLKAIDDDQGSIGIQRAVLINPPVNLFSSIDRLDRLLAASIGDDTESFDRFYYEVYTELAGLYEMSQAVTLDQDFLLAAAGQLLESDRNLAAAIALSFRLALVDLFFAGDLYSGAGVVIDPENPPTRGDSLYDAALTLRHKSFSAYLDEVFAPFYLQRRPGETTESLVDANHLEVIGDRLRNDPDYFAQTNRDELILDQQELDWLREVFGSRMVVYDEGGHLGNLGDHRQIRDLLDMVSGQYGEAAP